MGVRRRGAMSGFGNTLFSGSRFIFWSLGPVLLLGGLAFLGLAAWPPPGAGLTSRIGAALLGLFCLICVPVLYNPARFWVASRVVTGTVFLAYLAYFISDPLKATRGLLVIGLPCLWWTLFGRFSLRHASASDQ